MFIWEHDDGSVSWTGSFNRAEWEAFLASRGELPNEAAEGDDAGADEDLDAETEGEDTEGDSSSPSVQEPAGNASTDEWRSYALSLGATEDDIADLTRNDLRDKYGSSKDGED